MDAVGNAGPDDASQGRLPVAALACGVLGVLLAIVAFWLILPSILLGIAAIVLAVRVRRNAGASIKSRELAAAGMALGLAAILFVPGAWAISEGGEDFGRDCALKPSGSNC